MKKVLLVLFALNLFSTSAYSGEKIQLTDYRYEKAAPLLDGYSLMNYTTPYYSSYFGDTYCTDFYFENGYKADILKPDGTKLYNRSDYGVLYLLNSVEKEPIYFEDNVFTFFPQNQTGDRFIVYNIENGKMGVIDNDGNTIIDFDFDNICPQGNSLFIGSNAVDDLHHFSEGYFFRASDGKLLKSTEKQNHMYFYINKEQDKFLLYTQEGRLGDYWLMRFYDIPSDKIFYERSMGGADGYFYLNEDHKYKDYLNIRQDPYGELYYQYLGMSVARVINNTREMEVNVDGEDLRDETIGNYDFLYLDSDNNINSPRLNKYYQFEEKEIVGKKYYALFKELEEGETVESYIPQEKPSNWAIESIDKASEEGLLYNNSKCFYKDPITREDFCILVVEAYCKTQGVDISEFISQKEVLLDYNKFTDTQNPYILLANELGIVNGFSDKTFAPYEYITRQQAAVMLNNTAKLLGLKGEGAETFFADSSDFENWAVEAIKNVSAIKNKEGIALMLGVGENKFLPKMNYTREQAYITIYRLYDMCK